MKHPILCFLLFLLPVLNAEAQSKKEVAALLTRDLAANRRFTLALNFDSMFKYMPPAMFDIIPIDSLISLTSRSMDNDFFSIEMTGIEYGDKPKIRKAGKYYWSLVPYDARMKFNFKRDDPKNKFMSTMMKSKFGSENIKMAADGMSMEINLKKKILISFKDPASPIWSFLEDKRGERAEDEMQKMLYEAAVPAVVRKAMEKQ